VSNVSAKQVVKYATMPGVIPRMKRLFINSFGMIAYLLANIYGMVRLLPRDHVYLRTSNIGRYGIRHVIAEAASHLEFKRQYWDRIVIFVVLLSGIVMLCAQLVLLAAAVIFDPVWAQTVPLTQIFSTPDPVSGTATSIDVAFLLLDRVFGIPGFFCTVGDVCTDILSDGRWPFHVALHGMFRFYSMGLLSVAILIFLYFIVVVVGETVTSGTPFGERFQNVWVPLRLVVALLLLTPVTYGINTGQYIALWSAKAGSSFATNGWHIFNRTLADKLGDGANPMGETTTLLSMPEQPDITPLIQAMLMVHGCAYSEWRSEPKGSGYSIDPSHQDLDTAYHVPPKNFAKGDDGYYIRPYLFKYSHGNVSSESDYIVEITEETTFAEALKFYGFSDVVIHFGKNINGKIEPVCGKIKVPVVDRSFLSQVENPSDIDQIQQALINHGGGSLVHAYYFDFVRKMWFGTIQAEGTAVENGEANPKDLLLRHVAHRFVEKEFAGLNGKDLSCKIGCIHDGDDPALLPSCTEKYPSDHKYYPDQPYCAGNAAVNLFALTDLGTTYSQYLEAILVSAHETFVENNQSLRISTDVLDRGWGGAGIWYNTIGQINGNFVSAVQAIPILTEYPEIMKSVRKANEANAANLDGFKIFDPESAGDENIETLVGGARGVKKAKALYDLLVFVTNSLGSYVHTENKGVSGNAFLDAVDFIFGIQGLYDMRGENANVHPIAQLSAVGKGIVDSAIRNIGISTGLSLGGGLVASFKQAATEKAVAMAKSLFSTTAYIGLTAGVVLYYIIPILPFVFFFFAVAGWVKGLFEAMVGVPLWSLAHLRIDGEGLPGEAASNGYFLILEIFLRPILIVFGLIAAMLIFGMQTRILQVIWDLVVDNVGGAAGDVNIAATVEQVNDEGETVDVNKYFSFSRGQIDQLFFTILYTIIVYMMATASFKLIDMIPDSIMRWAGSGVSSFGDADKNPSDGLMRYAATGGMMQGQRIVGAGDQFATGLGNLTRPKPAAAQVR
tara:strand:+ start:10383 stop:13415 length:3033 start_codon:yes stop_codon:yes gene_type:complete